VDYRAETADERAVLEHLQAANAAFSPRLSERVDLGDYAAKLVRNAVTFEAWKGPSLVGLVACYLNDTRTRRGFISHVAVLATYHGRGVGRDLLERCLERAHAGGFQSVGLEVAADNVAARGLYAQSGFDVSAELESTVLMSIDLRTRT
jgi:ribosomal protein S18 acetylase RimI-like enzyme